MAACVLAPVTVRVRGGATPTTARCGFDTVLAGHPDHAVELACRSRTGGRTLIGLAALATAAGAAAFAATRRPSTPQTPAAEVAATDIAEALAPFDLTRELSSNRTQGVPNMIALVRETAARLA